MELEERIAKLESAHARLVAQHNMLTLAFCYLLQGELNEDVLATLKERQIANALHTLAPDAAIDGCEIAYGHLKLALANWRIRP